MSESFSDLWASSGPAKPQQLPLKSLVAAANSNNSPNPSRRPTPDAFTMLASAGSSQPGSRPITPSAIKQPPPSKPAPSNGGDVFGGLVSFGVSTSRDDGLTIADRAAKAERDRREQAERDRREQAEREHAALKSQGSFWDQFEGNSKPPANSVSQAKTNGTLDFNLLDVDDLATFCATQPPQSKEPSRSNTPGSFDFGDREDTALEVDDKDVEDDILGSLAKPTEQARRTSPRTRSPSPLHKPLSRTSSPPPHVLGRIVEMGFSVQQAKVALAATDTGLDVDTALEILLQNACAEPARRERERERDRNSDVESMRRRNQGPSQMATSSQGSAVRSGPPPVQQGLQDQADKLLAQASTIGLSMFSKANAIWKEGREKVFKAYEEQRAASVGGNAERSMGKPRWMEAVETVEDGGDGFTDNAMNIQARETRAVAPSPISPQMPSQDHASLFTDEEPMYRSPARRRPLASTSASTLGSVAPPKSPSPSPTPAQPIVRPIISASPLALAASNAHKASGTEHFKLGRFAESEDAYSRALAALPPTHVLRVPLYNNRALARLRTGDYKGTVDDAGEAMQIITGDLGLAWHPGREAEGESAGVDLGTALGKALRRRAEAHEGMEKWKESMADWERLIVAAWVGQTLRGDALKGASRCRRMLSASGSAPASSRRQISQSKPVELPKTVASRPSDALARVRDANSAQEIEDQARHDVKDGVDARLAAWRTGKETNIRALIASLDTVLWPELGWQKVGMAELVSPGQVKVRYTKAISKLHPDKLNMNETDVYQRMIANGVFSTLNEAWNAFR